MDLVVARAAIERAVAEVTQAHTFTRDATRFVLALAKIDLDTAAARIAAALQRREAEL